MKQVITLSLLLALGCAGFAQTFYTKAGYVGFFSETPMENIEAENQKLTAVLDTKTGKIEFAALIKSFEFEKALMEEHFNENYMESNKYPKANFKGMIQGFESMASLNETVTVKGTMSMHGVEKEIIVKGTIVKTADGGYEINATFMINPQDYDIEIPNAVRDKIAEEVEVTVKASLMPLKK